MNLKRTALIAALGATALVGASAGASAQSNAAQQQSQIYGAQPYAQDSQGTARRNYGSQNYGYQNYGLAAQRGRFAMERSQIREALREGRIDRQQAHAQLQQIRMEHRQMREARLARMQQGYSQRGAGQSQYGGSAQPRYGADQSGNGGYAQRRYGAGQCG